MTEDVNENLRVYNWADKVHDYLERGDDLFRLSYLDFWSVTDSEDESETEDENAAELSNSDETKSPVLKPSLDAPTGTGDDEDLKRPGYEGDEKSGDDEDLKKPDSEGEEENKLDDVESKADEATMVSETESRVGVEEVFEPDSDEEELVEAPDYDDPDRDYPSILDETIYRFSHDFLITGCLQNRVHRKVYTAVRKYDKRKVVIITVSDMVLGLHHHGVPREVRILKALRKQPYVSKLLGWCRVDRYRYALLFDYINHCSMVSTSDGNSVLVRKMVKSVLEAVKVLHTQHIVHRDIAKENILWDPLSETSTIIDFESAAFSRPRGFYRDVGRDRYDAPEKTHLLAKRKKRGRSSGPGYNEKADIYAVGVLFWMLISNKTKEPAVDRLRTWAKTARRRRKHTKHPEIDLLLKLVCENPARRLNVHEALAHPYFTEVQDDTEEATRRYTEMKEYLEKMQADDNLSQSSQSNFDYLDDLSSPEDSSSASDTEEEEEEIVASVVSKTSGSESQTAAASNSDEASVSVSIASS